MSRTRNTRREFIVATVGGVAGLGLSATGMLSGCAKSIETRGACHHDCPDTCSWIVTTKRGEATQLVGDPHHPLTRGELCGKMAGFLEDVVYNPDRLLYPLRRVGAKGEGKFERVSWEAALDEVARRVKSIIAESGPTAVLPYSYEGTQGIVQGESLDRRFFARLGASRIQRTICGAAGYMGVVITNGNFQGILPEDAVHARLILVWGTNPVRTNAHTWQFIEEARRQGAKLVVIDPIRTETAARADQHVRPLPGSDAALALAMMNVIIENKLHDTDFVEKHTLGFDKLRERAASLPLERAAELTGLRADEIVALAKAYATTRPSLIKTLVGLEHHGNGAMMFRAINCLPALVGAWRQRGGGMLHMTAELFAMALKPVDMPELVNKEARSFSMVQLGRALTDEKLAPPIRALFVYNSNPAVIAPDQNRVLKGLERSDLLTVVVDHFMTDTARHADFVFPATTQLEHLDLMKTWGHTILSLNRPAIAPRGEAVPNSEFFRRLAAHLGFKEPYLFETDERIVRSALASDHPFLKGITFERLMAEGWAPLAIPSPFLPYADGKFQTDSGKCELYAAGLAEMGLDPMPRFERPAVPTAEYPLALLTNKSSRNFLNSSHANQPRRLRAEGEPRLLISSADAATRGIKDGDRVRVFNEHGSLEVRARVTDEVRAQVVSLPHGFWPSRMPGGRWTNALTPDTLTDIGAGGAFHDALVQVAKV
jgi:anaerobic selenocysteine-containing dehydrogenase